MRHSFIYLFFISIFMAGCSNHAMDPQVEMKPPKYVEQMPAKDDEAASANAGSLFGLGDAPLYSDRKAMKVNDIVRVAISERSSSSSSGKKQLQKTNNDNLGAGLFTVGNSATSGQGQGSTLGTGYGTTPALKGLAKAVDGVANIGFGTSSSYNFNSTGANSRTESFTTTISARVIKVMANNTYFIDGSRELLIDGEKQQIRVSGVIRADDISVNNQIDSSYISDAKIIYETQGDIARSATKGWASKAVEAVWPF